MTKHAFVVPFRWRGNDPLRLENVECIKQYLTRLHLGPVLVVDDGREGDAQFNRSVAYNKGWRAFPDCDVFTFYESDMIVPYEQVLDGIAIARGRPGLVVPFTKYCYLTPGHSDMVRKGVEDPDQFKPEYTMDNGTSIGAVNTLSRKSLEAVGQWDEVPDGNGYDDNMMHRAFEVCCGPTRYVTGPGFHLFHQPAWYGLARAEVTAEDKAATARNKARYRLYQKARTAERIRELTAGGN